MEECTRSEDGLVGSPFVDADEVFVKRKVFEEEAAAEMYSSNPLGIMTLETEESSGLKRVVSVSNLASSVLCPDWTNSLHV